MRCRASVYFRSPGISQAGIPRRARRVMFSGMNTFTIVHVVLSLIGILTGFIVVLGMLAAKRLSGVTALFLVTTVATSVTGFFFPFHGVTPGIVIGVMSLVSAGGRGLCAVWASYCRSVALGVRRYGDDGAIPECVCVGCAALRKSAGTAYARSHAIRSAIQDYAARRSGVVRRARFGCGGEIPPWTGPRGLIPSPASN